MIRKIFQDKRDDKLLKLKWREIICLRGIIERESRKQQQQQRKGK